MASILVVEDEANLSRFIELELQHEGYSVTIANDGTNGYELAQKNHYDLILLDVMLPGKNGFEFCTDLRKTSNIPIIMLTARDEMADKIAGLDYGANDYITKPFAIEELLARIRSTLRSSQTKTSRTTSQIISVNGLSLDPVSFLAKNGDQVINLTKKEFLLLKSLMQNKNNVQSREQLLKAISSDNQHDDSNIIDVFIRYLRNKLESNGLPKFITTVRGIGYVVREN